MKKVYPRKCKVCKEKFVPKNAGQIVCGFECSIKYSQRVVTERVNREKKEAKQKVKTKGEYLKELQAVFNKYIRLRDKDEDCISCGKPIKGVRHASHYKSVGSSPSVRFNEDNVWVSCYKCNVWLSGNLLEYRKRLIDKIGLERVLAVEYKATKIVHYSIQEILELKDIYKKKIKELLGN